MAVFKCKMCGGALDIQGNATVAECEYCGAKQTLPKLDDERRANLYDRANHFRRNNEFDKAMGIYEQILNEDNTDAEAYWSIVLCRYGIEYVEDPSTHKRVPTVNRAQFTSVFDDDNYKSALQYADTVQRGIYEAEAKAINEIQKGILAISANEEPFDVFVCYKESDANGRRTPDSVLAQELYYQLTQEGFKVFFARITLEDKLGSAYEPYIFAALNSAKVMVALGTKPEYFNAVWVKNEWSRYLALIKQGQKKIFIPAYKDMDPYDLPEEFSHLQAQDMSKLGFMQDLIRGIKKILHTDEPKPATVVKETVVASGAPNTAPLLKRAFMFLEDGDWNSANEYCEKVLDIDPENAQAYLGKLMAECKVNKQEALKDCAQPFDNNNNYKKVIRFADDELRNTLSGYITHINTRNENARLEGIYQQAKSKTGIRNETALKEAAKLFDSISSYKDSAALAKESRIKAEEVRKDEIYTQAKIKMQNNRILTYEAAIQMFKSIHGWKDSAEQIEICKKIIEEIKAKNEAERIEAARIAECERKAREAHLKAEEARREAAEKRAKRKKTAKTITVLVVLAAIVGAILFGINWYKTTRPTIDGIKYVPTEGGYAVKKYKGTASEVTILSEVNGEPVIEIVSEAFEHCEGVFRVTIPDSVTTIGNYAFQYCTSLTSITIPDSVTTIGNYAFQYCTSLTSITIPDSVTTIGERAFWCCDSLTSVTIGNSVTTIEAGAFGWCENLTSITIPDGVTTIGGSAFYNCTSLTSVTIGNSVTEIDSLAFASCDILTNITIPSSITRIDYNAFDSCDNLRSVVFEDTTGWYIVVYTGSNRQIDVTSPAQMAEDLRNDRYNGRDLFKK